jgi:hypothetical protein
LWWGISSTIDRSIDDLEGATLRVAAGFRERGTLPSPATVVMVSASPSLDRGATNFLRIRVV